MSSLGIAGFEFVDAALGGVENRNHVIRIDEIPAQVGMNGKDCYATYFRFTEDLKQYVTANRSVKGYPGVRYSPFLPFDFDNKLDLAEAQKEAGAFVRNLQLQYDLCDADLENYFSGAKGFHVQLPGTLFGGFEPSEKLPHHFKELAKRLGNDRKYDPQVYDGVRLWRLPNTINSKTGLHKIPLTVQELFTLSIEEIRKLAKNPRLDFPPPDPTYREGLAKLYREVKARCDAQATRPRQPSLRAPSGLPPCLARILEQGVDESQPSRDLAAFVLARQYLLRWLTPDQVLLLLAKWDRKNRPPLGQPYLEEKVRYAAERQDTSFHCEDFQAQFCQEEPDCVLTRQQTKEPGQGPDNTSEQGTTPGDFSEPCSVLLAEPDEPVDWLIEPLIERESLGFIGGEPKLTKSILASHLAVSAVTAQPLFGKFQVPKPLRVFYVQEEDGRRRVKRRLKALVRGLGGDQAAFTQAVGERLRVAIRQGFRIDEPDWFKRLQLALEAFKPDLVIFDVLANLHGMDENDQRAMSKLMKYFQALRDTYHCAVLIVHHFKKMSREGGFVQPNQRLRGSSVLAAASENSFYLSSQPDRLIRLDHESKDGPVEPFVYAIDGSWTSEDGVRIVHRGEAGVAAKLAKADAFYAQLCHQFDTVHEAGCTVTALSSALAMSKNSVRSLIKLLLAQRRVQEDEVMVVGKDEKQRKIPCFLPILGESSTGEDVEE